MYSRSAVVSASKAGCREFKSTLFSPSRNGYLTSAAGEVICGLDIVPYTYAWNSFTLNPVKFSFNERKYETMGIFAHSVIHNVVINWKFSNIRIDLHANFPGAVFLRTVENHSEESLLKFVTDKSFGNLRLLTDFAS